MTKYSMRHLLYIALFLLYCTCGCFAAVVQQLPQKGQSALQTYTLSTTSDNWQPIRIAVYTKLVEDVMNHCEKKKGLDEYDLLKGKIEEELKKELGVVEEDRAEEFVEEFEEELGLLKSLCTKDNVMTREKKKTLFTEVLPKAIKLHTDRLKVNRVGGKSKVTRESVTKIPTSCHFFKDPLDKVQEWIDVDFMIFAGLSNEPKTVKICSKGDQKRPTSAVIKFVPKEINATRQYIRITAHEVAHGLGFQHEHMTELNMIQNRNSELQSKPRSKSLRQFYMVKSEKSVEMLEKHYKCEKSKLTGLYLENEEKTWNSSHWERYIAKDELMSTYFGEPSGMYYSALTLAIFEGMKHYQANFSMAEPMGWGNHSICQLLEGKKEEEVLKIHSNIFCEKDAEKVALRCTSDRFALGICSTEANHDKIPQKYQYIKDEETKKEAKDLMDGVPFIRPLIGTACEDGEKTLMPGSIVSNMSRCLNLNKPLNKKGNIGSGVEVHGICAKVKCDNNKVSVLKGYRGNEEQWQECLKDGDEIQLEGSEFIGESIVCPRYEEVCTGLLETEVPTDIKFYNGKTFTVGYDVDVNDVKKKEEKQNTALTVSPSAGVNQDEGGSLPLATPPALENEQHQEVQQQVQSQNALLEKPESKNMQQIIVPAMSSDDRIEGAGTSIVGNNRVDSSVSGSNGREKSVAQSQANESGLDHTQAGHRSPSSAPGAVAPADPAETNADEILKDQKEHLKLTDTNLNDHSKRDGSTPSVSSQHTDSLTESRVQQNEMQTLPKPSKDNRKTQNQVQSPNELKPSTKESTPQIEVSSASSSSINVTPTAASPLPEVSSTPTNVALTVETDQPEKNETTNNTSPSTTSSSTDVHERNNASTTAKEPITEDKNKDSAANKVEDLANQLVTIGEKNADGSITISYIGGCLIALLVCVVGFVMVP